ncbi:low temperature requirement protein A [Chitinimonas koreensis]|uniref:low temperature requirement protein A n=1 Tax=Chitinimonas koreensis TaxID=356302 RepID=UPI0004118FF8|nr:low temperature requirement protein A [Chitinimonas koreensis]QNM97396.1 low temperature requirement protein A [Chitinimonas koreensis]
MRSNLLRGPAAHGHHKVTFVELFFDLVFVFAITQLSHGLIAHFGAAGALHTLLLLLAVWWVWIYTSWVTNWFDPERIPVRCLLLALMLAGLLLSSSIPAAFEQRGLAFAGAYVAMQVGRNLFVLWSLRHGQPGLYRNFVRIQAWLTAAAVFWIAGGLLEDEQRLACWLIALAIDYASPAAGFWTPGLGRSSTADWNIEGGHLAERAALFIIIALGESILVTGATFSAQDWNAAGLAAFAVSFVGSLAMWWLYFDVSAEAGSHTISHSADPGRLARLAYTYLHLPIVAGIIVAAVADEFVLAHPTGHSDTRTVLTVLGGPALYLLGCALFKWAIANRPRPPVSPFIGIAVLAALAWPAPALPPLLLSALATLVLVAIAAWERRIGSFCPEHRLG